MRESMVAVASPELIGHDRKLTPTELLAYPLLQQSTRPYVWRQWFASSACRCRTTQARSWNCSPC
jgi:LysR family glycine cleavage system transcriptional activator